MWHYRAKLSITAVFIVACITVFSARSPLPKRLVIGLDGVGYQTMRNLQRDGYFRGFHPASRNISTFPALSGIAWADIFRVLPPEGYHNYHYHFNNDFREVLGTSLRNLGASDEFENVMHYKKMGGVNSAQQHTVPALAARTEFKGLRKKFFASRGTQNFYAYIVSTDSYQHLGGDLHELLRYVSEQVDEIQTEYRRQTGENLELVLLSDHGILEAEKDVTVVNFKKHLFSRGLTPVEKITHEKQVAFTSGGVITSVAFFCLDSTIRPLVQALSTLSGVELVTSVDPTDPSIIRVMNSEQETAVIRRSSSGDFAYLPEKGDPLSYLPIRDRLKTSGQLDVQGFASAEAWLKASVDAYYPVALERIYRGHREVTLHTAPVLVSLKPGYVSAEGMMKTFSRIKNLGNTHGALEGIGSTGMLMTNFKATSDTTGNRVMEQVSLSGTYDFRSHESGVRIVDEKMMQYYGAASEVHEGFHLQVWYPTLKTERALQSRLSVRVIAPMNAPGKQRIYAKPLRFNGAGLSSHARAVQQLIPLEDLLPQGLVGHSLSAGTYVVNASIEWFDPATGRVFNRERLEKIFFDIGKDGNLLGQRF